MRICICEDEPSTRALLRELACSWVRARGNEAEVRDYASAEAFLFEEEGAAPADILLLDIEMPGESGMALARRLRADAGAAGPQIVFVTGVVDYALEGYEVDAVSYLLKPVREDRLFSALDRAAARLATAEPALLVGDRRVLVRDVVRLEAKGHEAEALLADGTRLLSRDGFAAVLEGLAAASALFVQTHRSYAVNVAHARRIGRKEVELDGGASAPIARGRFDAVNCAWLDWMHGLVAGGRSLGAAGRVGGPGAGGGAR